MVRSAPVPRISIPKSSTTVWSDETALTTSESGLVSASPMEKSNTSVAVLTGVATLNRGLIVGASFSGFSETVRV